MASTTTLLKIMPFLVKNEPSEDSFENEDDETLSEKTLETIDQTNVLKRNLDMNGPNETVTVSTSVNNIEDMTITCWTITEKEFENIPDVPNNEKIVLISIRSKDESLSWPKMTLLVVWGIIRLIFCVKFFTEVTKYPEKELFYVSTPVSFCMFRWGK